MNKKPLTSKPGKDKPDKPHKPDMPDKGVQNVPATIHINYRTLFEIRKGNDIDGDRYPDSHRGSATIRDAKGDIVPGMTHVTWSVVSTSHPVEIRYSGFNPQNSALFSKNIQSEFRMTVTGKVTDYPHVVTSVTIVVKTLPPLPPQ